MPAIRQHRVLLVGILIVLLLRGCMMLAGAALISRFVAVFYLFGVFLIYTAHGVARSPDGEYKENAFVRLSRRVVQVSKGYYEGRSMVGVDGQAMITPMLVVMIATGVTDLLFALDSVPAVFGLTRDRYLVFAVNAFALTGLRQLYFLIGRLIRRFDPHRPRRQRPRSPQLMATYRESCSDGGRLRRWAGADQARAFGRRSSVTTVELKTRLGNGPPTVRSSDDLDAEQSITPADTPARIPSGCGNHAQLEMGP